MNYAAVGFAWCFLCKRQTKVRWISSYSIWICEIHHIDVHYKIKNSMPRNRYQLKAAEFQRETLLSDLERKYRCAEISFKEFYSWERKCHRIHTAWQRITKFPAKPFRSMAKQLVQEARKSLKELETYIGDVA